MHPVKQNSKYCQVLEGELQMNVDLINIAYFGVGFYPNRKLKGFFELLNNDKVRIHIFASSFPMEKAANRMQSIDEFFKTKNAFKGRVVFHSAVDNLEMLNLCTKMDYLYIEDIEFAGLKNPYIPSKIADYLTSETPIIARVQEGSALSKMKNVRLIRVTEITKSFAVSLEKTKAIKS